MKNGDYHLEAERGRPRLGPLPPGSSVLDAIGGEAAGLTGLQPRTSRLVANPRAKSSATAIGSGRSAQKADIRWWRGEWVTPKPSTSPALSKSFAAAASSQWVAWLALYHAKLLFTAEAADSAERGPQYTPADAWRTAEATHLARLTAMGRYTGCIFASPVDLANHIAYTAVLDLLVKNYAAQRSRSRADAEGLIKEMEKRLAGDKAPNFDGMKHQVQKAIEIYETEIAGRPIDTNIDASVDAALAKTGAQVDQGQSRVARATLPGAAEEIWHEEEKRRERYVGYTRAAKDRPDRLPVAHKAALSIPPRCSCS
jgi:hypothetical protein